MNKTRKMPKAYEFVRETLKAFAALVVTAAAYLVGVLQEEQGLSDLSTVQWLGLLVFMGTAYGLTYFTPNKGYKKVGD